MYIMNALHPIIKMRTKKEEKGARRGGRRKKRRDKKEQRREKRRKKRGQGKGERKEEKKRRKRRGEEKRPKEKRREKGHKRGERRGERKERERGVTIPKILGNDVMIMKSPQNDTYTHMYNCNMYLPTKPSNTYTYTTTQFLWFSHHTSNITHLPLSLSLPHFHTQQLLTIRTLHTNLHQKTTRQAQKERPRE